MSIINLKDNWVYERYRLKNNHFVYYTKYESRL